MDSETMEVIDTAPMGEAAPSEVDGTAFGDNPVDTGSETVDAAAQEPSYTVKIDGEEVEVNLDELRNGYQRQKDYTRKTQEVSDLRKRLEPYEALASALDRDPEGTLKALYDAYGISAEDGMDWDQLDPQEQRIQRLEKELDAQRARDARNMIESDFRSLEEAYGEIDRDEVRKYAIRHGLDLPTAYRAMNFDSIRSANERLAKESQVLDQKRSGTLPSSAGGTQKGSVVPATSGKKMSLRESYQAALKTLS